MNSPGYSDKPREARLVRVKVVMLQIAIYSTDRGPVAVNHQ
jgi:hypothetical protein